MFIERIFRADIQPPAGFYARQWLHFGGQRYVSIGVHQSINLLSCDMDVVPVTECPYTTISWSTTQPEHPDESKVVDTDGMWRKEHLYPSWVLSKEGLWCNFPYRISSLPANQFPRHGCLLELEQMYYQWTREFSDMKHVFCTAINLPIFVQATNYRLVYDGAYWACIDGSMSDEDEPICLKHHLFARGKKPHHACTFTEDSYTQIQQALWSNRCD